MFADQGRVLWNSAVNIVEGTINTAIDTALINGGRNPTALLNPNRPQADFSSAKTDYRSEMMRRNLEGKLDGDGIKAGQFIETGVTILAPIVVGAATAPKVAPQSLKTLGGIPEVAQVLKVPQGLSETQFAKFSQTIRQSKAAEYGTDIRVHGSRAAGTATKGSDIDVAIRVPKEKFDQLIKEAFKNVNPGSSKERTMKYAIKNGIIQRGEVKLSNLGKQLENRFGFSDVDISVVREG
nr:nucleotidyltransferase domain-containing protein [Acidobacteriota bacterium]